MCKTNIKYSTHAFEFNVRFHRRFCFHIFVQVVPDVPAAIEVMIIIKIYTNCSWPKARGRYSSIITGIVVKVTLTRVGSIEYRYDPKLLCVCLNNNNNTFLYPPYKNKLNCVKNTAGWPHHNSPFILCKFVLPSRGRPRSKSSIIIWMQPRSVMYRIYV